MLHSRTKTKKQHLFVKKKSSMLYFGGNETAYENFLANSCAEAEGGSVAVWGYAAAAGPERPATNVGIMSPKTASGNPTGKH